MTISTSDLYSNFDLLAAIYMFLKRRDERGQALVISMVIMLFLLGLSAAVTSLNTTVFKTSNNVAKSRVANASAEAGIKKALWCLNNPGAGADCGGQAGSNFTGENNVTQGDGVYTTTVTTIDSLTKQIDSVARTPNSTTAVSSQHLRVKAVIETEVVSFNYALQAGEGGLNMSSNATVTGNVYSNGDIVGRSNALISGDVFIAGGTAAAADQHSLIQNSGLVFGKVSTSTDAAMSFSPSASGVLNYVKIFIKKIGSPSNKTLKIMTSSGGKPTKTSLASATLDTSLITTNYGWVTVGFTTPPTLAAGTTYWILIDSSTNSTNYLAWGADSTNGYANGAGKIGPDWNASSPVWNDAGADLAFETFMNGDPTGLSGVVVQGNLHANTIASCTVNGSAYFQLNNGCSVGGASYPGSADPGPTAFPISDAQIDDWKDAAKAGGTIASYSLDGNSTASLGPKEITGDLTLSSNAVLTLTGPLYVHGNINIASNGVIRLDPSFGSNSVTIITDDELVANGNTRFTDAGIGSFIIVISTKTGTSEDAITLASNATGAVFYAPNGKISLSSNARVTGLTAKLISLSSNATLVYDTGLADITFTSGPGGSWILSKDSWREIK